MIVVFKTFIILFCLLLNSYGFSSAKKSCQGKFAKVHSFLGHSVHRIKDKLFSPIAGYVTQPPLKRSDPGSIHRALNDGAAVVNINPFTPNLGRKMRRAINASSLTNPVEDVFNSPIQPMFVGISFWLQSYKSDWKKFESWMFHKTKIISSQEITQFKKEVDQYLYEVQQTILKADGKKIEPVFTLIRTEIVNNLFTDPHKPTGLDNYLIANVAIVGPSTFYVDKEGRKVLSRSGNTILLSGLGRINTLSEEGVTVVHGTPNRQGKRFYLTSIFKVVQ